MSSGCLQAKTHLFLTKFEYSDFNLKFQESQPPEEEFQRLYIFVCFFSKIERGKSKLEKKF